MSEKTPAEMVEQYIKLRDHKKAAEAEFKKSLTRVNEAMEKLEALLLDKLQELGADSLACDSGTVYRNTQYSATVTDRQAFRDWINENDLWEVADLRANKAAIRELLDEGKEVAGVKFSSYNTVGVRRSS